MVDKRPININPLSIKLPITALISISHRISGVFVFLLIPVFLWMLESSLASEQSYNELATTLGHWFVKLVVFVLLASLIFHLLAGIRHLVMDMHIGESLHMAKLTSILVFIFSAVIIFGLAIWLWG